MKWTLHNALGNRPLDDNGSTGGKGEDAKLPSTRDSYDSESAFAGWPWGLKDSLRVRISSSMLGVGLSGEVETAKIRYPRLSYR